MTSQSTPIADFANKNRGKMETLEVDNASWAIDTEA
jgi:hypothetical protein